MDINLESLYQTVDQLGPDQRAKLIDYLTSGHRSEVR